VRAWDLAATEAQAGSDPDWTVGLRLTLDADGLFLVEDVVRLRGSPHKVERAVRATAERDGKAVRVVLPQDPGQAGKAQGQGYLRLLAGFDVRLRRETGDKITRAGPVSAQAEAGNLRLLRAPWNAALLDELENFPEGHDDQVDALAGAFRELVAMTGARGPQIR
jgi:predicted phage terminase large subunit-like protein